MKKRHFKRTRKPYILQALLAAVGVGMVGFSLLLISFAATTTVKLYVSPASKTTAVNTTFNVQVRLQSTENVRYVKAYLDFTASKLQVKSISSTNSSFSTKIEESYDNNTGQVKLTRSSSSNRSGTLDIATVTFQAKQSGTGAVSFNNASTVASNQYYPYPNLITAKAGGTYTITASATQPPTSTPTPTTTTTPTTINTSNGSGSAPRPTTSATPTTTPPVSESTPETTTASSDTDIYTVPDEPAADDGAETPVATVKKKSSLPVILGGVGVLAGLGTIGAAVYLRLRRKPSLPKLELEDSTPAEVVAELNKGILDENTPPPEAAAPEPDTPLPPQEQPPVVPPAPPSPPPHIPPPPSPASPQQPLAAENPDEPRDMFDTAEEQYHYNEKFKTPPK